MDNEITVFHVSNGLSTGGAERMVYDLCNSLSKNKKYRVFLILTDPDDPKNVIPNLFDRTNIRFQIIDISDRKHDVIGNNIKLKKLIKKYKPKVVHTHQITLAYCVLSYIAGRDLVKIHTIHSDSRKEFGSKLFRMFYHVLFILFNINIVSISEYIERTTREEYFLLNSKYQHLIYNGRTMNNIFKIDKNQKKGCFDIIIVGRLVEVKNHITALLAMDFLINDRKLKNIKLSIYGDGPLRSEMQEKIDELSLSDNVYLRGSSDEINKKLSASDVFLMTSLYEGFPISAIEAMNSGLPLILSNFGSAYEFVQGNGFIVPVNDVIGTAKAILELYENKDVVNRMSARSKELSNKFSLAQMVKSYENLYTTLLEVKK